MDGFDKHPKHVRSKSEKDGKESSEINFTPSCYCVLWRFLGNVHAIIVQSNHRREGRKDRAGCFSITLFSILTRPQNDHGELFVGNQDGQKSCYWQVCWWWKGKISISGQFQILHPSNFSPKIPVTGLLFFPCENKVCDSSCSHHHLFPCTDIFLQNIPNAISASINKHCRSIKTIPTDK